MTFFRGRTEDGPRHPTQPGAAFAATRVREEIKVVIEVKGLTKRYGEHHAIRGLNFEVQQGDVLGFLGPNGAGKTTTMRILTCYYPPSEGVARVDGFDVFSQSLDVRRRVGYLP